MENPKKPKVVVIGGGTGSFVVLSGLKKYPLDLTAIVTMSDSGGSNKRIRDEFGLLPTSDIRQCFVALSSDSTHSALMRKLFMYRFDKGEGIIGMTFGNLFMAALSDILGSQEEAIRQTGKVLRIRGRVTPVSFTNTNLVAIYEDGTKLSEEHLIDEPPAGTIHSKIAKAYLEPKAKANPQALEAIKNADYIIVGPGDLYTSIIPNLLVDDIANDLCHANAKKIFVLNLMTKYGQTTNLKASEHIKILEDYVCKGFIDYVIVNTGKPSSNAIKWYKDFEEYSVEDDLQNGNGYTIIREDFLKDVIIGKDKSDTLKRSIIRHDQDTLASELIKLIQA